MVVLTMSEEEIRERIQTRHQGEERVAEFLMVIPKSSSSTPLMFM